MSDSLAVQYDSGDNPRSETVGQVSTLFARPPDDKSVYVYPYNGVIRRRSGMVEQLRCFQ